MDADRLEQMAAEATPGPWDLFQKQITFPATYSSPSHVRSMPTEADAALIALAPLLARDHAALLRWAENAREVIEADAVEAFGPLLAALDDLRTTP